MTWIDFMSIISVPLMATVIWIGRQTQIANKKVNDVKADLLEYKTEVAQTYVSIIYLKDVEIRIIKQLEKIEEKLDRYADIARK